MFSNRKLTSDSVTTVTKIKPNLMIGLKKLKIVPLTNTIHLVDRLYE